MPWALNLPSAALAFAITLVEMTEVVALVFALSADHRSIRPAALGAIAGTAVVAAVALLVGAGLEALPRAPLLWGAGVTLFLFGLFLLRSTIRTYRKLAHPSAGGPPPRTSLPFAGGFAVGAVEAIETVIVLLALAAAGNGASALVGASVGGAVLVGGALMVHERIRRVKVPTLKLSATSALFAFAFFWGGQADGIPWPGPSELQDLWLIPLFAGAFVIVRSLVAWRSPRAPLFGAKG